MCCVRLVRDITKPVISWLLDSVCFSRLCICLTLVNLSVFFFLPSFHPFFLPALTRISPKILM